MGSREHLIDWEVGPWTVHGPVHKPKNELGAKLAPKRHELTV